MRMRGRLGRVVVGALVLVTPVLGGLAAAPAAQAQVLPHSASVVNLYYDSSGAPGLVAQIDQAVANWNSVEHNVHLAAGPNATIIFHETNDGQGSYTTTDGHGNGDIYIDDQQIAQGYDPTRIAAHEVGHNLGLPDHYSGPCSEIMSGHGPGTSCTNAMPDAQEAATVDQNFVNGFVVPAARRVYREPALVAAH